MVVLDGVGKQRECPNCGAIQYGKKRREGNEWTPTATGVWCSNCGYNKPAWVLL